MRIHRRDAEGAENCNGNGNGNGNRFNTEGTEELRRARRMRGAGAAGTACRAPTNGNCNGNVNCGRGPSIRHCRISG